MRRGSKAESKVAKRYVKGGYKVKKHYIIKHGEIDILAKRGKETLAIEVKSGKPVITSTIIRKLVQKARSLKAKPVLALTSNKFKITSKARKEIKKYKVRIKRL